MRGVAVTVAAMLVLIPGLATAAISCSEIPKAQSYINGLKPGPNTRAAQRHLDAAKAASSPTQCAAELRKVDYYARRSAAADRRLAEGPRHTIRCADALHQDRPGGSDYRGPPVAACPTVR